MHERVSVRRYPENRKEFRWYAWFTDAPRGHYGWGDTQKAAIKKLMEIAQQYGPGTPE